MNKVAEIETTLAVPPERDEMVVQLVARAGPGLKGVMAELIPVGDEFVLEVYAYPEVDVWTVDPNELISVLTESMERLQPLPSDGDEIDPNNE